MATSNTDRLFTAALQPGQPAGAAVCVAGSDRRRKPGAAVAPTLFLLLALQFLPASTVMAETYRWTDRAGNLHFSDSLQSVPAPHRDQVTTSADITTADPEVREEVEEGRRRAEIITRQEREKNRATLQRIAQEENRQRTAGSTYQPARPTATAKTVTVKTQRQGGAAVKRRPG